jgi:PQQ-dependent catabolism-associated beta-propeller protein
MTVTRCIVCALWLGLAVSTQTVAKGTGYVFVSNEQTNNIAVIDPKQEDRVIKWIETSRRPRDMVFRNDRQQLLVACGDDNVIDVIDVATLAVTDHVPTGANPQVFELSRDQKTLYVSNAAESTVQQIGVEDKFVEREISTGAGPGGMAVSSDGNTLYVTSEISDWVHVVDLAIGAVTDNILVGTRPTQLLLMPGGKELWVSNELSGQVSIIDRSTNDVSGSLYFRPPGPRQIDVTPGGLATTPQAGTAFVTLGRANYVAFVDTVTRMTRDYVPVGRGARAVALNADEKTLYVVNGLSDDVSIIDVPSRKVIKVVPVGHAPHSVQADD